MHVYACLIDASKAFDMVYHCILFDKLLERKMPKPLVCLLLNWYKSQQLCVRWMGRFSDYFQVSNGVRQGGVLSPIVFTIYLESLELLQSKSRGWYWDNQFSAALWYADDITVIALSPDALRKMDCEAFTGSHGLKFNVSNTQLICFRWLSGPVSSCFWFVVSFFLSGILFFILVLYCSLICQIIRLISRQRLWHLFTRPILFFSAFVSLILLLRKGYFMHTVCLSTAVLSEGLIVKI